MTEDFEDPRKTELRQRVEAAADAAGYTVDSARPIVAFAAGSGLNGGIRGDVVATGSDGVRRLFFIRVEGEKPLPGWLRNHVSASAAIDNTEIYVVVEAVGDQLMATCAGAGAGLLTISAENNLEKVLDYAPADDSAAKKEFDKRLREVRRRLDTKLQLNLSNLEKNFQDSFSITSSMPKMQRDGYLNSVESMMVAWRAWGDDMSESLDGVAAGNDLGVLAEIEKKILAGPPGQDMTAA